VPATNPLPRATAGGLPASPLPSDEGTPSGTAEGIGGYRKQDCQYDHQTHWKPLHRLFLRDGVSKNFGSPNTVVHEGAFSEPAPRGRSPPTLPEEAGGAGRCWRILPGFRANGLGSLSPAHRAGSGDHTPECEPQQGVIVRAYGSATFQAAWNGFHTHKPRALPWA
jgi:hypothetical protein